MEHVALNTIMLKMEGLYFYCEQTKLFHLTQQAEVEEVYIHLKLIVNCTANAKASLYYSAVYIKEEVLTQLSGLHYLSRDIHLCILELNTQQMIYHRKPT